MYDCFYNTIIIIFFSLSIYNLVIWGQCTNHVSLIYTYLTLILICNAVHVITQVVCLIHGEVSNFWQVLGFLQVLQSWYIWSIVENGLMIHNPSCYIWYLHHINYVWKIPSSRIGQGHGNFLPSTENLKQVVYIDCNGKASIILCVCVNCQLFKGIERNSCLHNYLSDDNKVYLLPNFIYWWKVFKKKIHVSVATFFSYWLSNSS